MHRAFTVSFFVFIGLLPIVSAHGTAQLKSEQKMNAFLSQLIGKMTLEEKVGQLVQYTADLAVTGASIRPAFREDIKKGKTGSILNAYGPTFTRELQKLAVENSRLKIPLLIAYDVIHGHRTGFPIPLAESASWNLKLMEEAARTAAREAAADGVHWTFAPMVDIARDPRWGRVMEGAGEDPWLAERVAAARVRGFKGGGLSRTDTLMTCMKHFAGYGAAQAGREYNTVDMSERELFETYLPPFKAAVDAGVDTVMPSFNEIAGIPSTANDWLLTDLLKKRWKFNGIVVSDYTAINELKNHGVAANDKEAVLLAFKSGVDIDMQGEIYSKYLPELVKERKISQSSLDAAVRRVLEAKYRRGLFEDPYRFNNEERAKSEHMKAENLETARKMARESIVLLKNANNVLPLKRTGTIALIGPFVENRQDPTGNWFAATDWKKTVTLFDGVKQAVGDKAKILYAKGANLLEDEAQMAFFNKHLTDRPPYAKDSRSSDELIRDAVNVAKRSDVVVLALGETYSMSGEAASRTHIRLFEHQVNLLRALHEVGKPIALVLFNGRPLVLEEENQLADAMVESWLLGTENGNAIADVLFGDYNPSGKITMTFPRSEGQIPIYYAQKNTGRPNVDNSKYTSRYIDSPNEPLFPFGYGLSYTHFSYSNLQLSADKMSPKQKLKISFTLKNDGDRDGTEIAQLYIRDMVASVTRPIKQLRGFERVELKAGESRVVKMELSVDDLKFYNKKMQLVAEPGEFKVMVGGSSASLIEKSFNLVK